MTYIVDISKGQTFDLYLAVFGVWIQFWWLVGFNEPFFTWFVISWGVLQFWLHINHMKFLINSFSYAYLVRCDFPRVWLHCGGGLQTTCLVENAETVLESENHPLPTYSKVHVTLMPVHNVQFFLFSKGITMKTIYYQSSINENIF